MGKISKEKNAVNVSRKEKTDAILRGLSWRHVSKSISTRFLKPELT